MNNLFNSDAELAVLCILLSKPEKVFEITGLKHFMFSSNPNELLFNTVKNISEKGLSPDFNLVVNTLRENHNLDKCGGNEYLNYLRSLGCDADNFREFERMVVDSYRARILIETSAELSGSVHSGGNVNEIISKLRNKIDLLGETSTGEETAKISDILPQSISLIKSRIGSGTLPGVPTGYSGIDTNTGGINPGDLWILGGRPSSGKSAMMLNMIMNMAEKNIPVLIFSLEMPKQVLIERLLAIKSGIPIINIHLGLLKENEAKMVSNAADVILDYPIYIDTNYYADLDYIIGTTKKYKRQKDIKIVFLDYAQLLADRTEGMRFEIGRICRGFKLLGNDLEIGSVILSQLNRSPELRDDKRPILSDLRESGDLEQDTDLAGMLYRDEYYDKNTKAKGILEFIIRKQRNGPIGTSILRFQDDTNKISEV